MATDTTSTSTSTSTASTPTVAQGYTANSAALTFPTDRWGLTAELQKAGKRLAAKVKDESQYNLAAGVYVILINHLKACYEQAKTDRAAYIAKHTAKTTTTSK